MDVVRMAKAGLQDVHPDRIQFQGKALHVPVEFLGEGVRNRVEQGFQFRKFREALWQIVE